MRREQLPAQWAGARAAAQLAQPQVQDRWACPVGVATALAGAGWPFLTSLDLASNFMRDEGVAALVAGPCGWPKLRHLDLSHNRLNDPAAAALAAANLPSLQHLVLGNNLILTDGALALASASAWPDLQSLDLSCKLVDEDGHEVAAALASGQWPNLASLTLICRQLGGRGAAALLRAPWPNLERLDVSGLSRKNIRQLRWRWPGLQVVRPGAFDSMDDHD